LSEVAYFLVLALCQSIKFIVSVSCATLKINLLSNPSCRRKHDLKASASGASGNSNIFSPSVLSVLICGMFINTPTQVITHFHWRFYPRHCILTPFFSDIVVEFQNLCFVRCSDFSTVSGENQTNKYKK
jgi:hypothetical protein